MKKLYDVLVVGELNVDLILDQMDKLPEIGQEVIAKKMTLTLGSSSAIFASNVSSVGAKVAFLGKIGNDGFGKIVEQSLIKSNVDISMIRKVADSATGITVILNVDEDRANTTYPGAMEQLTINDISDEDLKKAKHLHFSQYFFQPGMWGGLGTLYRRAKNLGLTTSFDMQWDPDETWNLDISDILPYVDVFLPNEAELKFLTKQNDLYNAIYAIKEYVNVLVVKRGNKGSVVYNRGKIWDLPPFFNEHVVDCIGAGDSFNAGFIYKFVNGNDLTECQRFGNLTGAISTTAAGGTKAFESYKALKDLAWNKFGESL